MRAVVQRVRNASVQVDGKPVSSINQGLLCLIGLRAGDTKKDADFICKKLLKTRVWPNKETQKQWDEDVTSGEGREILLVSQFTLYGRLKKPKPDFSHAMPPQEAREFYQAFVDSLRKEYDADKVKDGVFGAMMDVSLTNDGPVTFVVDSTESSD